MTIHEALNHRRHGIETIVVIDPPSPLPLLWRNILTKLGATFQTREPGKNQDRYSDFRALTGMEANA
jgi:hypothetical protein